jgi:phosphomannomutase
VGSDELPEGEDLVRVLSALGPGEIDRRDGLKWVGTDGWVHVRPSNTEPVVRIIAEAQDEAAAVEMIKKVKS